MEQAMKNPMGNEDIVLKNSNIIVIPKKTNIVNVVGGVYYPNAVSFTKRG